MHPEGIDLSPSRVLAIVNGEDGLCMNPEEYYLPEDTALVVYRHLTGELYSLGRKDGWQQWKEAGYQSMGSVELIRDLFQSAQKSGVRDKSIPWYLLRDVEREERGAGTQR